MHKLRFCAHDLSNVLFAAEMREPWSSVLGKCVDAGDWDRPPHEDVVVTLDEHQAEELVRALGTESPSNLDKDTELTRELARLAGELRGHPVSWAP